MNYILLVAFLLIENTIYTINIKDNTNYNLLYDGDYYDMEESTLTGNGVSSVGFITDVDAYVQSRYPNYVFFSEHYLTSLNNFNYYLQYDTSAYYYMNCLTNEIVFEGNCALNIMFNIFKYYSDCKLIDGFPNTSYRADNSSIITLHIG